MSEELNDLVAEIKKGKLAPVYLLCGEEFLARKSADSLVDALVPDAAAGLNLISLDGASPGEIAAELATMPLFPGRKVVRLFDPEFLLPKKARAVSLTRARDAWKANRRTEAARRLLSVAANAGIDLSAFEQSGPDADAALAALEEALGATLETADVTFVKEVAAYARAENVKAPAGDDASLVDLLKTNLPPGHALVIATHAVEKRHPLYKVAKDAGVVLEHAGAARLKDLDVTEMANEIFKPLKARAGAGALELLKERCGANYRLLENELEKVALYAAGGVLTKADVELLVSHAREDEFMELSDALQKRDCAGALKYIDDSVALGAAPLALLGAMTSIIRTLLVNHERARALTNGRPPKNYADFQARVFPAIEAEAKAKKAKVPHPYASFMGMQAASGFGLQVLLDALVACADADLALKFGGDALVLERIVWSLCGLGPAWKPAFSTVRKEQER